MAQAKVAVRLGTEGKEDAKRDFREYGDAGDAAAARVARGFDKASQDVESALRRQAAAAQKIAAIMPQTATQMRINDTVGTGSTLNEGSARISAAAFRELYAEQDRLTAGAAALRAQLDPVWAMQQKVNVELAHAGELFRAGYLSAELYEQEQARLKNSLNATAAALERVETQQRAANQAKVAALLGVDMAPATSNGAGYEALNAEMERQAVIAARIRAELDPLWAAQQRYNLSLNEARAAHAAGALSAELLTQRELALKQALDLVNSAHNGGNVSAGQYRAGMQQLGFQFQDLGVQLSMAAGSGNVMKGVMTALAMQGPQVVSAIALMRGSAGGFIGFLSGPWGAAIMAATSILAILGSEFLSSGDDAEKAAGKVDRYTASLIRLASIQGKVAEQDLANARLKVEMLRGQQSRLDQQIGSSQGTRAMVQRRGALMDERTSVSNDLMNAEATAAGAQIAYDNRLKLDAMVADKANAKSAKSAESEAKRAARAAEREREREAEAAAKAELALMTQRNGWANDQDIGAASRTKLTDEGDKIIERHKAFRAANDDISAGNALLNLEWELRGKSRREIEAAVELRRYQLDLERDGKNLTAEQIENLVKAKAAQMAFTSALDDTNAKMEALRDIGSNVVDTVLNPSNWTSWKNVGLAAINDVVSAMWKMAVINPIQNRISGGNLPTIGSLFGLFKGGGSATNGGSAIGNNYTPAGSMLVGENGPERVIMPQGAKVMTASETRRMANNDNGLQVRVIKGDLFDVEITRISAGVSTEVVGAAAPIIATGASNGAQMAVSKRNGRRLA